MLLAHYFWFEMVWLYNVVIFAMPFSFQIKSPLNQLMTELGTSIRTFDYHSCSLNAKLWDPHRKIQRIDHSLKSQISWAYTTSIKNGWHARLWMHCLMSHQSNQRTSLSSCKWQKNSFVIYKKKKANNKQRHYFMFPLSIWIVCLSTAF